MIFNVIILQFNLIIIVAFRENPAFSGKGFLPFSAGRKIWHSVKIRQRIPCGFYSAEFLAFSGNPKQSFRVQKLRNFWHSAEIERTGRPVTKKKMKQKPKNALQTMFC